MPPGEDLASLCATGATLVLHLAVQRIEQVAAELLPHYGAGRLATVVAYTSQERRWSCAAHSATSRPRCWPSACAVPR